MFADLFNHFTTNGTTKVYQDIGTRHNYCTHITASWKTTTKKYLTESTRITTWREFCFYVQPQQT
jgi:hypothetical protein